MSKIFMKSFHGDLCPGSVAAFDDDAEADRLVGVGGARYLTLEEEASELSLDAAREAVAARVRFEALSAEKLRAIAAERKVDLGTAKTAKEIIVVLDAATVAANAEAVAAALEAEVKVVA